MTLADGVATDGASRSAVSVATAGLVAYRTGAGSQRQLTWFDRSGTARGTVGDPDATLARPRVSRDGRRVAVARTVQGNTDVWLLDGARTSRLTFDAAVDSYPVWSPDGSRIVFGSNRTGQLDLYQMLTLGGVEERLVRPPTSSESPTVGRRTAASCCISSVASQGNVDLWVVPMVGERTPSVFLKTPFREAMVCSRRTAGGWPTNRTNRGGRKSTCGPFVPPGAGGHGRRGWRAVAGVHCRRRLSRLAARRQGAVLPQPGWRDDGGADHRHRDHARTGRAGGALSHARRPAAAWTRNRDGSTTSAPTDGS